MTDLLESVSLCSIRWCHGAASPETTFAARGGATSAAAALPNPGGSTGRGGAAEEGARSPIALPNTGAATCCGAAEEGARLPIALPNSGAATRCGAAEGGALRAGDIDITI